MQNKWFWMMDYCQKYRLPPAQKWAWDKAEKAYIQKHKN
jgi:hypothetical protein